MEATIALAVIAPMPGIWANFWLWQDDAVLAQQSVNLIGLGGACLDESLACPVQGQHRL
jgi:hypothetical protein